MTQNAIHKIVYCSNILKHGISFELAELAFDDPNRLEFHDNDNKTHEDRYKQIGRIDDHFLFVIYTMENEKYRIISARSATKSEIRMYFERN